MKFELHGEAMELSGGIKIALESLNTDTDNDVYISVSKGDLLNVRSLDLRYEIIYSEKAEFFRGLAILNDKIASGEKEFSLQEIKKFDRCGVMIDCSRNAVPTVENLKNILFKISCMGLNTVLLYTEDTYEVEEYPYFGYMRGAYKKEEIRELDAYAQNLGIELVPCIQTLAHLETALRWEYAANLRDNGDVLLIDEPKTYDFIEAMIKSVSESFSTRKIHIGMDEAHGVGLGNYLLKNGYKDRFDILASHLRKVMQILDKYSMEPMMWSDMFFRLGSKDNDYYDVNAQIPSDIEEKIPKNLSMVFWDYYHDDEELYDNMIKLHQKMGREVVFAGGIWIWRGMGAAYHKTISSSKAALKKCRENGVKNVFATVWQDDGAEVPLQEAYLGMQLWAEYNYYDEVTDRHLEKMFKVCTGYDMEAFLCFNCDEFDRERCVWDVVTVSKNLLYQDILCGLFDKNFSLIDIRGHYEKLIERVKNLPVQRGMEHIFEWYKKLLEVLLIKSDIGTQIQTAYKKDDKEKLLLCVENLKRLKEELILFKELYIAMWDKNNKAFGFDMIDMRLGGVIARTDTAIIRITSYINGNTQRIEELDQEKLLYKGNGITEERCLLEEPAYHKIQSASSKLIY